MPACLVSAGKVSELEGSPSIGPLGDDGFTPGSLPPQDDTQTGRAADDGNMLGSMDLDDVNPAGESLGSCCMCLGEAQGYADVL